MCRDIGGNEGLLLFAATCIASMLMMTKERRQIVNGVIQSESKTKYTNSVQQRLIDY